MHFDAHAHLFSRRFFAMLYGQKHGTEPDEGALRSMVEGLGLELPPEDPRAHAEKWVSELDRAGVDRMVLLTSLPGEQESVSRAAAAAPDRLVGYTMVNPKAPGAAEQAGRDIDELGLRGVELFPAMHRFDPSDEELTGPLYEIAADRGVPVFCHVGLLRVRLRERLGLSSPFDMRYSDPMLLHRAAADHPEISFIIPHFGCGYLREAALLGSACPNVYVDTSSSNGWMALQPQPIGWDRALQICLDAFGTDRILFGSDSGVFPRGYRTDVLGRLTDAMHQIGLPTEDRDKILGGNLTTLLPP